MVRYPSMIFTDDGDFFSRLYRSWAEMLRGQPPTWRTDFVIFSYNYSAEFRTLGCVNRIRQNKEEPSTCRLFLYIPVRYRTKNATDNNFKYAFDDAKKVIQAYNDSIEQMVFVPNTNDSTTFDGNRSESLYTNLREYGYIDSINTLYEGYNTFKMYDFVLRTDIGKDVKMFESKEKKSVCVRCVYLPTFCNISTAELYFDNGRGWVRNRFQSTKTEKNCS